MCLYIIVFAIKLSLPTIFNNSLALTYCCSHLKFLFHQETPQLKPKASITAQYRFICTINGVSQGLTFYNDTYFWSENWNNGETHTVSRGGVLNFKSENTLTKVSGYNYETILGTSCSGTKAYLRGAVVAKQRSWLAYGKHDCDLIGDYEFNADQLYFWSQVEGNSVSLRGSQ